jgi:(R,R)-butanediol dehydrogenase / meso-butanediol dehydrogenase / diacetyl reductase
VRALVWEGPGTLRVGELPEPVPGPGEVVIEPVAGICGSEVEGYLGRQQNRVPPLVMGHELAGVVLAAGPGADPRLTGMLVAVNPIVSCGNCSFCGRGARNLCRAKELIGIARPGGFAERVAVPAANLAKLPAGTDPRAGAFVEPMANGVHAARLALGGRTGARAVVVGAGAIGLCALQALRQLGAGRVDVLEPDERRRATATAAGADHVHADAGALLAATGAAGRPRARPGTGADALIDAAGTAAARAVAADAAAPGATVVLAGMADDRTELEFRPVVRDEIVLRGSYAYSDADFGQAAAWLAAGRVSPGPMEPPAPLEAGPALFERLAAGPAGPVRLFLTGGTGHG